MVGVACLDRPKVSKREDILRSASLRQLDAEKMDSLRSNRQSMKSSADSVSSISESVFTPRSLGDPAEAAAVPSRNGAFTTRPVASLSPKLMHKRRELANMSWRGDIGNCNAFLHRSCSDETCIPVVCLVHAKTGMVGVACPDQSEVSTREDMLRSAFFRQLDAENMDAISFSAISRPAFASCSRGPEEAAAVSGRNGTILNRPVASLSPKLVRRPRGRMNVLWNKKIGNCHLRLYHIWMSLTYSAFYMLRLTLVVAACPDRPTASTHEDMLRSAFLRQLHAEQMDSLRSNRESMGSSADSVSSIFESIFTPRPLGDPMVPPLLRIPEQATNASRPKEIGDCNAFHSCTIVSRMRLAY